MSLAEKVTLVIWLAVIGLMPIAEIAGNNTLNLILLLLFWAISLVVSVPFIRSTWSRSSNRKLGLIPFTIGWFAVVMSGALVLLLISPKRREIEEGRLP